MHVISAGALLATAACAGGPPAAPTVSAPCPRLAILEPPPVSKVYYVFPRNEDAQLGQLDEVVNATAVPGEQLIVSRLGDDRASIRYTVREGDTLTSIGTAFGTTPAKIYAANPQIRATGRSINLIITGETLVIPNGQVTSNLFAGKAPDPIPGELQTPRPIPSRATRFVAAPIESANAVIAQKNCEMLDKAARRSADALQSWSAGAVRDVRIRAQEENPIPSAKPDLGSAVDLAIYQLSILGGRPLMILLDTADADPPTPPARIAPNSLAGLTVFIANLADPTRALNWKTAWATTGAQVISLDPATTKIQLIEKIRQLEYKP